MEFRTKTVVIGVILLLSIAQINAKVLAKRQAQNGGKSGTGPPPSNSKSKGNDDDEGGDKMMDLDLGPILNNLESLPVVGPYIEQSLDDFIESITTLDKLSNGVISRILGGALPCEISVPRGIVCSGVSREGVYSLIEATIDDIPAIILPGPTKMFLLASIRMLINPIANFLFGGLPQSS